MTNTHSSKFRIASGLLAGLTIGLTVTALAAAPAGTASADTGDYVLWQSQFGTTAAADLDHDGDVDGSDFLAWQQGASRDTTVDAADYVVWRKNDGTAQAGDPVIFTVHVTNHGW